MQLRATVRDAREMPAVGTLRVKSTAALLEPGLVGVWRPVLLLPQGIVARFRQMR